MVIAIVKAPHGDSARALVTAIPSPAIAITTMKRMATIAVAPATGEISVRAMSASDLPPRRTDAARMMKSWVAPANTTPRVIQSRPGMKPNWAASTGPMSGPAPEMAAK
jgi:hypothetical protein